MGKELKLVFVDKNRWGRDVNYYSYFYGYGIFPDPIN